jgi:phosphoglycolate phosphatase
MLDTVIFDLDGTLTDSFDGIAHAFNHALGLHGFGSRPDGDVKALIGNPLEDMLRTLMPGMSEADVDAVAGTYREHYITICGERSPLLPGVTQALDLLGDRRLVCASTKYTPQVLTVLEAQGISDRFELMQGSEDIPKKPAPDLFLKVMALTGASPESTAAVGDAIYDVKAAIAVGCLPVGVLTGLSTREQLEEAGCRHIFPDLLGAAEFICSME